MSALPNRKPVLWFLFLFNLAVATWLSVKGATIQALRSGRCHQR